MYSSALSSALSSLPSCFSYSGLFLHGGNDVFSLKPLPGFEPLVYTIAEGFMFLQFGRSLQVPIPYVADAHSVLTTWQVCEILLW